MWDNRKGTAPIQYITAHLTKIHGLDWHPTISTQLATSSQDNTVKFFDTSDPRRPEYMISTNAPVWRARYTPFGNGLITVVVPQLRRGENSLLLWNTANRATPVHTFVGHKDVVLEFGWRKQKHGERDFQLVTWSKDQNLLVWRIEPFLQKLCGHEPDDSKEDMAVGDEQETASTASSKLSNSKVQPLYLEFQLLNVSSPNLEVLAMDLMKRLFVVRASLSRFLLTLQVTFPNAYPHGVPPNFQLVQNTSVDEATEKQVITLIIDNQTLWLLKHSILKKIKQKLITIIIRDV